MRITYKNHRSDCTFPVCFMLCIRFIQSSMFRLLEGVDRTKNFLLSSERVVNPNIEQLTKLTHLIFQHINVQMI